MQLKSSSRSGIRDNTGLTGGRGDATSGQTSPVIRPATGDAGFTASGVSNRQQPWRLKNKPQRRANKPPGYSGRPGRPFINIKSMPFEWGGGAMCIFEQEMIIQSALGEAN